MRKVILTILALTLTASAFWPAGGVKVVQTPEAISNPQMVYIEDGSVVISWEADRLIYCQKLDTTGVIHWEAVGVRVCLSDSNQRDHHMVTDGQDVWFVWQDERNDDGDIYGQKIDGSTGQRLWDDQGKAVCVKAGQQYVPDGAVLANGDFAATWFNLIADPYAVEAQRLDINGEAQWNLEGLLVSGQSIGGTPKVLPSGDAFLDVWTGIKAGDTDGAYLAQRVDLEGNLLWDTLGVLIEHGIGLYGLCSDIVGGAVVLFSKGNGKVYAQRIDSTGQVVWNPGGVQLNKLTLTEGEPCNSLYSSEERWTGISSDGMGGCFAWWEWTSNHEYLSIQHLDSIGNYVWDIPGIVYWTQRWTEIPNAPTRVCSDGNNGVMAVFDNLGWESPDPPPPHLLGIYAQRINSSGQVVFDTNGVAICLDSSNYYEGTKAAVAVPVGAIAVWLDKRNHPNASLYAQIVDTTGKIGSAVEEKPVVNSPLELEYRVDLTARTVLFSWSEGLGNATLSVFDACGRLVNQYHSASNSFVWDSRSQNGNPVSEGVYFVNLKTANAQATKKLVLFK